MSERISNIMYQFTQQMKKIFRITLVTFMLLSLFGCSQKEPSEVKKHAETDFLEEQKVREDEATVISTYDVTDPEFVEEYSEQNKLVTKVKYYEMSDGTWRTDTHTYKYRLEITGRMNGAAKDRTFVFLSNLEDITFGQAWKASGLSSNTADYFEEEEAKLVAVK